MANKFKKYLLILIPYLILYPIIGLIGIYVAIPITLILLFAVKGIGKLVIKSKEKRWLFLEVWGPQILFTVLFSWIFSTLTISLYHLYKNCILPAFIKNNDYTWSKIIDSFSSSFTSSLSSTQSLFISIIGGYIYWRWTVPIHRKSLLRMIDYLEQKSDKIQKMIVTTTNPGRVWLKQKELLLYLVSNIKINKNKISRHIIGDDELVEEYKEANFKEPISLLSNPTALIRRFHHNCINLYGHKKNKCICITEWEKLTNDERTFIYIEKSDSSYPVVYVYSKSWLSFYEFEEIHDADKKNKIKGVAMTLEQCSSKISL